MGMARIGAYICMLQAIYIYKQFGTLAAKVSINQNITGLLGNKDTHLTCSFSLEKGEQIISVQIIAKNITEDFDEKKNIIAIFKPKRAAELKTSGEYLAGRVTLKNITNTSINATLKFHILKWTDNRDYKCKLNYNDKEDALQNVKSDATRILVKVPARDVHIKNQPNHKQYDRKTDITLTCKASGNPEPQYTWFKDDNNKTIISRTNFYVIEDVIRNNSGVYTCEAYNNINSIYYTHSNSVEINIVDELLPSPQAASSKISAVHAAYAIPLILAVGFIVICLSVRKHRSKQSKLEEVDPVKTVDISQNMPTTSSNIYADPKDTLPAGIVKDSGKYEDHGESEQTAVYSEVIDQEKMKYEMSNSRTSVPPYNVDHNEHDVPEDQCHD